MVPGITGLAQLHLPPDTEVAHVERKLTYDLYYARHLGLRLDLRILAGTVLKVVGLPARLIRSVVPLRSDECYPVVIPFPSRPRTRSPAMNRSEIPIASPCSADWSTMTLADRGRFCGQCRKVVRELAQLKVPIVTSLGVGKADNWAALTSGRSGIHEINRFPTDHLNTRIAGTVDFLKSSNGGATALTYELAETAAVEAMSEAGLDDTDFGGPLFLASPPVRRIVPGPAGRGRVAARRPKR